MLIFACYCLGFVNLGKNEEEEGCYKFNPVPVRC